MSKFPFVQPRPASFSSLVDKPELDPSSKISQFPKQGTLPLKITMPWEEDKGFPRPTTPMINKFMSAIFDEYAKAHPSNPSTNFVGILTWLYNGINDLKDKNAALIADKMILDAENDKLNQDIIELTKTIDAIQRFNKS